MKALAPAVDVIATADVVVQNFERQSHNQSAAMTMHNGLGQTCGAT